MTDQQLPDDNGIHNSAVYVLQNARLTLETINTDKAREALHLVGKALAIFGYTAEGEKISTSHQQD